MICRLTTTIANDEVFDLVIDQAALVHTGTGVKKLLCAYSSSFKTRRKIHYTPYADTHSSALSAQKGMNGPYKYRQRLITGCWTYALRFTAGYQ